MTHDGEQDGRAAPTGGAVLRGLIAGRNAQREGAGAPPALPRVAPVTPARAAATAAGRAGKDLYGLPVRGLAARVGAATLAELAELLPDPALLAVVQDPAGALGVMALTPDMIASLIEVQALGRVTARPVTRRRPTLSDAMICADYVDALLTNFGVELATLEGFEGFGRFRYVSHLDDQRPLMLMLEDASYRTLAMDLQMGGTQGREAQIFLALPQPQAAALPKPAAPDHAAGDGTAPARTAPRRAPDLGAAMRDAPIDLVGVLCRKRLTLAQLRGLAEGATIPLPRAGLGDIALETRQGQVVARGRLGEIDGHYAVRLGQGEGTGLTDLPSAGSAGDDQAPIDDLDQPDSFRAAPLSALSGT